MQVEYAVFPVPITSNKNCMSENTPSIELLSRFAPMDGLKRENLAALAKKAVIRELKKGENLFKIGDREKRTYYLLTGKISMTNNDGEAKTLEAGNENARNPIMPVLPRQYSVAALTPVQCISLDTDLLDVMLTWDQTGHYEVSELQDDEEPEANDWMTTLLQTKAFQRIPPGNIQAIFMRMQQVNFNAGDVVIKQGDDGDYFYVITKGSCSVTRETPLNDDGIQLAELNEGDTFGEEALISEARRNATVTMLTDGSVMRLEKDDFNKLLNEPTDQLGQL